MHNHFDHLAKERANHRSKLIEKNSTQVHGWGVDLEPSKRPAYPKEKIPEAGTGAHYDDPVQQLTDVEIFKSVERPTLPPVVGTTCPPKGLSGAIRRFSYARYTENELKHWFLLMAADRVDVVEGILQDLAHGHVPNIWKEMGLSSELKYNKKNFFKKVAISGALIGIAAFALSKRRKTRRQLA